MKIDENPVIANNTSYIIGFIERELKKRKIKKRFLAKDLKMNFSALSRVFNFTRFPSMITVFKIFEYLDLEFEFFDLE